MDSEQRREQEILRVSLNISKLYELLNTKELSKEGREDIETQIYVLVHDVLPTLKVYDI